MAKERNEIESDGSEVELPAAIENAIGIIRAHLDDCCDIGEACEIQEQLEALAAEYDDKGTELAEQDADEQLGLSGDSE